MILRIAAGRLEPWGVARHAALPRDRDRLDLLDRCWLRLVPVSPDLGTNGKVIILGAKTSPVGMLPSLNFAD